MRLWKPLFLTFAWLLLAVSARGDVKPHPVFSDNMVLQQGTDIVVWGKADPGEGITVTLTLPREYAPKSAIKTPIIVADKDGNWKATLVPARIKAGTGFKLEVKGKNTVTFDNVAIGEVWICSGQSNMQWEFWRPNLGEQSKTVPAAATNPNIRLMTLKRVTATTPQEEFPVVSEPRENTQGKGPMVHYGRWLKCEPESVQEFSAVAYYFGRELEKALKVPVGLIVTSWGGMPCEAYTSLEALDAEPSLKHYADRARTAAKKFEMDKKPAPPNTPTVLYNAMTHPLIKFPVKGAIWYQGESNAPRAHEYRTLFPAMIKDWRARWKSELPFMAVQLAPFWDRDSNGVKYAELRDAQLLATKVLPKVGLAVITDVGNEKDIHPPQKEPVGQRLALNARALAYGEKIVHSGPIYSGVVIAGERALITFDHIGGGLVARDGDLTGFTAAGADQVFHPAKAVIDPKNNTVVVTCDKVKPIKAVRYGWVNFAKPTLNLFNKEGLPASPFRTDEFPLTTMDQPMKK